MIHDPLCTESACGYCECVLLANARADERRKIEMAKAIDTEEVKDGIADMISDCFLSDPTLTAKGHEVAVACMNIARRWKS